MGVPKTIQQQLYAGGKAKVWSWGAHAWTAIDDLTLQFKVNGRHFNGYIRVELNEASDTYNVHLGRFNNRYDSKWKNIETIDGVFCDMLTDVIDSKVEYIKEYGEG